VEDFLAFELVGVTIVLVRSYVLDLEGLLDVPGDVVSEARGDAARVLDVVGDPGQQVVNPTPVLLVHVEVGDGIECLPCENYLRRGPA